MSVTSREIQNFDEQHEERMKRIFIFFLISIAFIFSLWPIDQYIYVSLPGTDVYTTELTITTSDAGIEFYLLDPSLATIPIDISTRIYAGNTKYYPNSTSYPHTEVAFSLVTGGYRLIFDRWQNALTKGVIVNSTWLFVVRYIGSAPGIGIISKNASGTEIDPSTAPFYTKINEGLTATIAFNPAKTPAFGSTYCFVTAAANQSVIFAGSATDPEGDNPLVSSYIWKSDGTNFNTGSSGPSRTFATGASYAINFTATEHFSNASFPGRDDSDDVTLVVKNAPAASIGFNIDDGGAYVTAPASTFNLARGATLYVSAAGSDARDPLAGGLVYAWDFTGDGTADAAGVTASHAFDADGFFGVGLTVTDQYGFPNDRTMNVYVSASGSAAPVFPAPTLEYPADGAVHVPAAVTLRWQAAAATAETGSLNHKLYVSTDPGFSACVPIDAGTVDPAVAIVAGAMSVLPAFALMLGNRKKAGRRRLGPALLAIVLLLSVSCPTGSDRGTDNPGSSPQTLQAGTTYYWKVRGESAQGARAESEVWSFTTE
jgi:hypothetical protein